MTRLRTVGGIDLGEFATLFGGGRRARLLDDAAVWVQAGALVVEAGRMAVPPARFLLSDAVIGDLFEG